MKVKIFLAILLYVLIIIIPLGFYTPAEPPAFLADVTLPQTSADFILYDQATGETITLTAAELLPNAVACEMDPASPEEAIKAQAVACYTWFCYQRDHHKEIVCDSEAFLVWTTDEKLAEALSEEDIARIEACVQEVAGEMLIADGKPIEAEYFAISAGVTADGIASPWDQFAEGYLSYAEVENLEIISAKHGYVEEALYAGEQLTGAELRSKLGLRSAAISPDGTVRGWGHGRGMSQAGAQAMAGFGATYQEILQHYYPHASLP